MAIVADAALRGYGVVITREYIHRAYGIRPRDQNGHLKYLIRAGAIERVMRDGKIIGYVYRGEVGRFASCDDVVPVQSKPAPFSVRIEPDGRIEIRGAAHINGVTILSKGQGRQLLQFCNPGNTEWR